MNIIQELKPLRYKDSAPKLLSYRLAYIPMSEARGFTLAFGKKPEGYCKFLCLVAS